MRQINFVFALFLILTGTFKAAGQTKEKLQKIIDKTAKSKDIFSIQVFVKSADTTYELSNNGTEPNTPYFAASVTKLYTSATILKLHQEGSINLDSSISEYLSPDLLDGIHVYNGKDYSKSITVSQLLRQTSGLPDYFEEQIKPAPSLREYLIIHGDTQLTLKEKLEITASLTPHFAPGTKGKAFYSDANFQLLGKIIENATQLTLQEAYTTYLFEPLGITNSFLYTDTTLKVQPFYHKSNPLHIPQMMASFQGDGGIVTTAEASNLFLQAFFSSELFGLPLLIESMNYNRVMGPFFYGSGFMKFSTFGTPKLYGHSGASGAFAFYSPKHNVYITGSVNQMHRPQRVYRMLIKLLNTAKTT